MPTANSAIHDAAIRHQINLLRLGNGVVRRMLAVLLRAERELAAQIVAAAAHSTARDELILSTIRSQLARVYEQLNTFGTRELRQLAEYEADFTISMLRAGIGSVNLDFHAPSPEQIFSAAAQPVLGRTVNEWFSGLSASAFERARDVVRIGSVEGLTTDAIVRRLRAQDGPFAQGRRNLEAVARTLLNGMANNARQVVYAQNSDLIKSVMWVSTLDARTTPICQSRDGNVYPIDKGPRPPAHVNCRSTTTPIVKGADALGLPAATRASMNGQVPENTTFRAWLARQPADVQDEVLGKTRGQLFRQGKLPMDKFYNDQGQFYTLDQLRERERAAFRRAGI